MIKKYQIKFFYHDWMDMSCNNIWKIDPYIWISYWNKSSELKKLFIYKFPNKFTKLGTGGDFDK